MTTDDVIRRLRAFQQGKPLPNGETLRVNRLPDEQLLILAFVKMGGESAPWGIAFGRPGKRPQMLTTPEPRTRDDVADMVATLSTTTAHASQSPEVLAVGTVSGRQAAAIPGVAAELIAPGDASSPRLRLYLHQVRVLRPGIRD